MAIRMSGLSSGLDTESIVSALTASYRTKVEKYQKAQTKLSWKQDAWKSANSKIYNLYTSTSSLRYSSAYNLNTTAISDSTKATVTASSDALIGTQSLKITQLAKTGYITGAKLSDSSTSTTLSDLGYTGGTGTIAVKTADGTTNISVTGSTTISSFVSKLKDAGVKANYDATNKRIFVSAADSGVENDFTLTGANTDGTAALTAFGLNVVSSQKDSEGNYIDPTYAEYASWATYSTAATEAGKSLEEYVTGILTEMGEAYTNKTTATTENAKLTAELNYAKAYQTVQTYTGSSDSTVANAASEIQSLYTTYTSNRDSTYVIDGVAYTSVSESTDDDGNTTYTYTGTDSDGNEISTTTTEAQKSVTEQIEALAKTAGLITTTTDDDGNETTDSSLLTSFESALDTITDYEEDYADNTSRVTSSTDLAATMEEIQAEIDANNDIITAATTTLSTYSDFGTGADYTDTTSDTFTSAVESYVAKIESAVAALEAGDTTSGASRIYGQDAIIELNDVEFTSSSNTITVNGLTINALQETGDDEDLTITTTTDVQGLYDKIKDFLTSYNEVINELVSLYNADSSSGYEPLTDEEKEAMTDSQIEKWESKIKDSLLRRDTTLNSVISTMTSSMYKSYTVNGTTMSLSTLGISTLGILNAGENEQYAYHIDGDSDDSYTSGNTDKLMAALQKDPDSVIDFMKQLTSGLYTSLDAKMKSTSLKSMYNVYNDKEMATEYSDYTKLISDWETRLSDAESRYFKQFSAMESALSTLNSNSSSLTSLLG